MVQHGSSAVVPSMHRNSERTLHFYLADDAQVCCESRVNDGIAPRGCVHDAEAGTNPDHRRSMQRLVILVGLPLHRVVPVA